MVSFSNSVSNLWKSLVRNFRLTFLSGVLVLIPLGLTFLILRFLYYFTVGRVTPYVNKWFPEYPQYLIVPISVVVLLIFLYLVGLASNFILVRQVVSFMERLISKIPLVKSVYNAAKKMTVGFIEQFASPNANAIIAIVPFPHSEIYSMGIVLGKVKISENEIKYKVFIPTVPNITIGVLHFYSGDQIHKCSISMEEAIEYIVSSGASMPSNIRLEKFIK
ncbi:MAG: DUF502 domain-containing protein [Candidatus Hydrogenedentes bacterium]|nr:DUF502 domain-containing protein [Candidatus Hydrogenedentota bacterium]